MRGTRFNFDLTRWGIILAGALVMCSALGVLGGEGRLPLPLGIREWLIAEGWSGPGVLEWRAQQAAGGGGRTARKQAAEIYHALLKRDPANPYRWCDWAETLQAAGFADQARQAMSHAQALGPAIAPVQVRAGNFYFAAQQAEPAREAYTKVLGLTHEYDSVIFLTLRRLGLTADEIARTVLPRDKETAKNFLEFTLHNEPIKASEAIWTWVLENRLGSDPLAAEYIDFLLKKGPVGTAAAAWAEFTGKQRGDYLSSDFVYNAHFSEELSGSRLDWHIEGVEGAETELLRHIPRLRIRFAGQSNVAYRHVWQNVWAPPGKYRIRARVQSSEVTTNQGVQLHLADPEGHRVDWLSEPVLGTHSWHWLEGEITIPQCSYLLLEVVRQPSGKFDNKISGTVEFQSISLLRSGPGSASSLPSSKT